MQITVEAIAEYQYRALALILSGCFVNKFNGAMKRMEIMLRFYMLLCWAKNDKL